MSSRFIILRDTWVKESDARMNVKVTYISCNFSVHIIVSAYSMILKNNENLDMSVSCSC